MSNDESKEEPVKAETAEVEMKDAVPAADKEEEKGEESENKEESDHHDEEGDDDTGGEEKDSDAPKKEETEEEKKKREELKKKYADWPLRNIKEPHENDVMFGRGGGTNHVSDWWLFKTAPVRQHRLLTYLMTPLACRAASWKQKISKNG